MTRKTTKSSVDGRMQCSEEDGLGCLGRRDVEFRLE
jgi:hypothetical protein